MFVFTSYFAKFRKFRQIPRFSHIQKTLSPNGFSPLKLITALEPSSRSGSGHSLHHTHEISRNIMFFFWNEKLFKVPRKIWDFFYQSWNKKWLFLYNHITYEYQTKNHLWDLLRRAHRQFNANIGTFYVISLKTFYLGIFPEKIPVFGRFSTIFGKSQFQESLTQNNFETKNI